MKTISRTLLVASIATLAACSDDPVAPRAAGRPAADYENSARGFMSNYVAIGTSVSMGWTSDGVAVDGQNAAWTKLLAEKMGTEFTVPGIEAPGCGAPYASPLGSFKRVDGSSALTRSTVCAPNVAGVVLPTHNLAIENATTAEALNATPETATQNRRPVTSRVLQSGMTQVSTMKALKPTFVSVELGGNELLPAQVGLLYPGVTYTPFSVFAANYAKVIEAVKATEAKAVLVSIGTDLRDFPTIRTGAEIASQRAAFAAYNVTVNANCDESPNFIFVRGIVPTAVLTGVGRARFGLPPYDLSCADVPLTADYIITPADMSFINALAAQMSAEIERHAAENDYAVFALGELFSISKRDVPFDLTSYLTSATPYGPLISLDGVHPSAEGHRILAKAAHKAIVHQYMSGQ